MAKKTLTQRATDVAEKAVQAVDNFLFPSGELKKVCEKQDAGAVRKILTDNGIDTALTPVLLAAIPEATRLKETIETGQAAESPDALDGEIKMLRSAHPRTTADAQEISKTLADVRERFHRAEQQKNAAQYARDDLSAIINHGHRPWF